MNIPEPVYAFKIEIDLSKYGLAATTDVIKIFQDDNPIKVIDEYVQKNDLDKQVAKELK